MMCGFSSWFISCIYVISPYIFPFFEKISLFGISEFPYISYTSPYFEFQVSLPKFKNSLLCLIIHPIWKRKSPYLSVGVDRGVSNPHFPPPIPPLPSPFVPTSLPPKAHFPPPHRHFPLPNILFPLHGYLTLFVFHRTLIQCSIMKTNIPIPIIKTLQKTFTQEDSCIYSRASTLFHTLQHTNVSIVYLMCSGLLSTVGDFCKQLTG